ncbi:hypothetical protein SmJEL517_g04147 [Synchytrium microbalum]|uniref:UPF3 domain-containing protein n=1 Tax=Synchytrium microbalum TaxID=1806994 RepID=A0A507C5T8_9FUNG|nr:uncharacterized protein SmJEL517_g04147 [Synchytrium microbalum]TPX32835.1 hypothetical protein SmJEL517_g04147 [Synchytrium microbalum]
MSSPSSSKKTAAKKSSKKGGSSNVIAFTNFGGTEEASRKVEYSLYSESRASRYAAARNVTEIGLRSLTRICLEAMAANIEAYFSTLADNRRYQLIPEQLITILANLVAQSKPTLAADNVYKLFIMYCEPTSLDLSIWANQSDILTLLKRHRDICENVRELNINDPANSPKGAEIVRLMPQLVSLDARGHSNLGATVLETLSQYENLTRLNLSFTAATMQDLKEVLALPKLAVLKLGNTPLGTDKVISTVINELEMVAPLQRLKVCNTDFGSASLDAVAKKFGGTLEALDMMSTICRKLAPLHLFVNMTKLNLSHLTSRKKGPAELPKDFFSSMKTFLGRPAGPRVETFIIGGTPELTPQILNPLALLLPHLTRLSLFSCTRINNLQSVFTTALNLENLDVSDTGVTDATFEVLSQPGLYEHEGAMKRPGSRLRFLNISKTKVGDVGIGYICNCEDLQELLLESTPITPAGVLKVAETGVRDLALTSCRGAAKKKASNTDDDAKLKIVLRRLPPNLPEEIFRSSINPWLEMTDSYYYCSGKQAKSAAKENVYSRAYIHFKDVPSLLEFHRGFEGHVFADAKGNETRIHIEFAPSQQCPKRKVKVDSRIATISDDSDYKAFLERLEKGGDYLGEETTPELPSKPSVSSPSRQDPKSTPLLDELRNKKAAQDAKSKKGKSRQDAQPKRIQQPQQQQPKKEQNTKKERNTRQQAGASSPAAPTSNVDDNKSGSKPSRRERNKKKKDAGGKEASAAQPTKAIYASKSLSIEQNNNKSFPPLPPPSAAAPVPLQPILQQTAQPVKPQQPVSKSMPPQQQQQPPIPTQPIPPQNPPTNIAIPSSSEPIKTEPINPRAKERELRDRELQRREKAREALAAALAASNNSAPPVSQPLPPQAASENVSSSNVVAAPAAAATTRLKIVVTKKDGSITSSGGVQPAPSQPQQQQTASNYVPSVFDQVGDKTGSNAGSSDGRGGSAAGERSNRGGRRRA